MNFRLTLQAERVKYEALTSLNTITNNFIYCTWYSTRVPADIAVVVLYASAFKTHVRITCNSDECKK